LERELLQVLVAVTVRHDFMAPALQFVPEREIAQGPLLDVLVVGNSVREDIQAG